MLTIFVKPSREGLVVYDELNRRIPSEGRLINYTTFIKRRLKDGSLIVIDEETKDASEDKPRKRGRRRKGSERQ